MSARVAVVGSGYWGKNLVRNFHEIGALTAVCDSDDERMAAVREKYPSVRCLRAFVEVAIATPAETHGDLVREALLAGKDVFVEKPLCLSPKVGEDLVRLARERGRVLMVGHLLWYHPAILKLKELVMKGELGRIQYLYSNRLNLGKIRREENILWSFAPHDVSVILGLLGEMPTDVQAQGGNYLHQEIADVTVTTLGFPSGVKAHVFVSWLHPFKEQKLVIVGEKKMAVFDDLQKETKLVVYPHSIDWKNNAPVASMAPADPIKIDGYEPLRAECEHFVECVKTRATPRTDGAEGLRVLTVLQRCQEALAAHPGAKAPASGSAPKRPFFAHESAFVDEGCEIGEGTTIWHVSHVLKGSKLGKKCRIGQNVVIGPNASVGDNVKIQNNVSVYEGVTLEDDVFCGPSMVFTNVINPRSEIPRMHELEKTLVKKGATLGANSTIVCGSTIGRWAFVGAGAVVTKDVSDYALVLGNPARPVGWMCRCGVRLTLQGKEGACAECKRRYRLEGAALVEG